MLEKVLNVERREIVVYLVDHLNCAPKSGQKTQQFKVTLHDLEVKAASNSTGVR